MEFSVKKIAFLIVAIVAGWSCAYPAAGRA